MPFLPLALVLVDGFGSVLVVCFAEGDRVEVAGSGLPISPAKYMMRIGRRRPAADDARKALDAPHV